MLKAVNGPIDEVFCLVLRNLVLKVEPSGLYTHKQLIRDMFNVGGYLRGFIVVWAM